MDMSGIPVLPFSIYAGSRIGFDVVTMASIIFSTWGQKIMLREFTPRIVNLTSKIEITRRQQI